MKWSPRVQAEISRFSIFLPKNGGKVEKTTLFLSFSGAPRVFSDLNFNAQLDFINQRIQFWIADGRAARS